MIQIRVVCDIHYSKGETPVLEFDDVREAEKFVAYLQEQIQFARGSKRKRLEFFHDGIYLDGEFLEIRRKHFEILKAFEFVDKISKTDLIYKVWNNSLIKDSTISATISQLNKELKDKDIFVYYDNGFYYIHRPA